MLVRSWKWSMLSTMLCCVCKNAMRKDQPWLKLWPLETWETNNNMETSLLRKLYGSSFPDSTQTNTRNESERPLFTTTTSDGGSSSSYPNVAFELQNYSCKVISNVKFHEFQYELLLYDNCVLFLVQHFKPKSLI